MFIESTLKQLEHYFLYYSDVFMFFFGKNNLILV